MIFVILKQQQSLCHTQKKLGKEVFTAMEKKTAAIGISGIQSILLHAYNAFSKDKLVPFATEEEAKEWLIKD